MKELIAELQNRIELLERTVSNQEKLHEELDKECQFLRYELVTRSTKPQIENVPTCEQRSDAEYAHIVRINIALRKKVNCLRKMYKQYAAYMGGEVFQAVAKHLSECE